MAGHLPEALALGTFVLLTLITALHGHCVLGEKGGYRQDPRYKWHPEMDGVRKGDNLLFFRQKNDQE